MSRPAIIAPDCTLTDEDLLLPSGCIHRVRSSLAELGIGPADRVAWVADNPFVSAVLLHAVWGLGATACPLSCRWPESLIADLLPDVGPVELLAPETTRKLLEGVGTRAVHASPGDAATIVFTSGSTSRPKPALLRYNCLLANARGALDALDLRRGDRWLLSLPLYHVGGIGILVRCEMAGATVVIPAEKQSIGEALVEHGITHVSLVPTQLLRLLTEVKTPPPALKLAVVGGAPVPDELLVEAHRQGWPVATTYGCTEMGSMICLSRGFPPALHVLPGREVSTNSDGEILVRGQCLFAGYLQGGRLTPSVDESGWYSTGDLGTLDGTCLTVIGRKDNLFISGGENIQPEEIERELLALGELTDAVVVPVADPEWGQRPFAFVRMSDGSIPDGDSLRRRVMERLPSFKVPVRFAPMPTNVVKGIKLPRATLRELAAREPW